MGSAVCTAAWEKKGRLAGIYSFLNGLMGIRLPWRTLCWIRSAGFNQRQNTTTCEGWDFNVEGKFLKRLANLSGP